MATHTKTITEVLKLGPSSASRKATKTITESFICRATRLNSEVPDDYGTSVVNRILDCGHWEERDLPTSRWEATETERC